MHEGRYSKSCSVVCRFFFHVSSRHTFVRDELGFVLADLRAAHRFALCMIDRVVGNFGDDFGWITTVVQVTNEDDEHLLSVMFRSAALKRKQDRLCPGQSVPDET